MTHRFYAPQGFDGSVVELAGTEAHHLQRVLRLKPGQEVVLFDGRGSEATAEIRAVARHTAELRVLSVRADATKSAAEVILATAIPKGDRFRWLVEKATELGVTRLVPLVTERSVVDPGDGKLDKMQQTVIAACKQSGRNTLMQIDSTRTWSELIERECRGRMTFIAHPAVANRRETSAAPQNDASVVLVVGPEGGWTDAEVEEARVAGAQLICLGPHILRIETAAVALVSWLVLSRSMQGGTP